MPYNTIWFAFWIIAARSQWAFLRRLCLTRTENTLGLTRFSTRLLSWVQAVQASSQKSFLDLRQMHKSKRSFSRNQEMQWMSSDLHSNLTSNSQRNLRWSFQHISSAGGSSAWITFCGVRIGVHVPADYLCELWLTCVYMYIQNLLWCRWRY